MVEYFHVKDSDNTQVQQHQGMNDDNEIEVVCGCIHLLVKFLSLFNRGILLGICNRTPTLDLRLDRLTNSVSAIETNITFTVLTFDYFARIKQTRGH
jgi:hypothetical protein